MQITLKLYAMLTDYLPAGADKNVCRLDLEPGTPVARVIEQLELPRRLVHLVLVNGVYVAPEQLGEHALQDGDTLAIWPPVAGG
ncbi:MAG: MoaD/ThiS family protein [Candidatus Competibacterales bacterium]|nr:MoaD/ThiS family protein [Candidatus Competibacterales bacterium]